MKLTQVRNATLLLDYAGTRILVDPMLAERGAYPPFPGTPDGRLRNPLTALPLPAAALAEVDAVIVTHLHLDHWDAAAAAAIPGATPLYAQDDADAEKLRAQGFSDVRIIGAAPGPNGIAMAKTGGQHGSDLAMEKLGDRLGQVCGVALSHPEEPTLYIAGDTLWNDHVARALAAHRPQVVVLNCGEAVIEAVGPIIMGAADVAAVAAAAPGAALVASHMEALNHCTLSRAGLRAAAEAAGYGERLQIPADGETLAF
ncbi:MBL fold metallo-hydrolase [Rhodovulum sp. DZ06]|uniref:MBL fold metallo-hydrolase n=1 Tax=Rhodovulum sp. DZ06 TaxID=3425126 RepID=UPI003D358914